MIETSILLLLFFNVRFCRIDTFPRIDERFEPFASIHFATVIDEDSEFGGVPDQESAIVVFVENRCGRSTLGFRANDGE